jgi:hypothetical protein
MESITRRAHGCGLLKEFAAADSEGLLASCRDLLLPFASKMGSWQLLAEAEELFRAIAFARRASGLPACDILPAVTPEHEFASVRAARRDAPLIEKLRTAPFDFRGDRVIKYEPFQEYGLLAGSFGDLLLEEELEARARELAVERSVDPRQAVLSFGKGVASAHEEFHGRREDLAPDADTHLGAFFDVAGDPPVVPPAVSRQVSADGNLASWDFTSEAVSLQGCATGVTLRLTPIGTDEKDPNRRYARLGVPGLSEIRLSLRIPPRPPGLISLNVTTQKAPRRALPFQGDCGLDVLVDGKVVRREIWFFNTGPQESWIAIPPVDLGDERQHEIALRLSGGSTTTLRIQRVSL